VNIPSYSVKPGDIISISPRNSKTFNSFIEKSLKNLKENRNSKTKSLHLEINYKTLCAIFLYPPQQLYHSYPLDINILTQ
jgi:ribosomal protein S4